MDTTTAARVPRIFVPSPLRSERLSRRVALAEAARAAGMSLNRASIIERQPDVAKPGELDRLRAGVERAAAAAGRR